MIRNTMESLSDKISGILSTAPALDPEDFNEETAKVVSNDFCNEYLNEDKHHSNIRKRNVQLLDEVDKRYAGKKCARDIFKDDSSLSLNEDHSAKDLNQSSDGDSELESSSNYSGISQDKEIDKNEKNDAVADINFHHIEENNSSLLKKGNCIRHQLKVWENLIEMRIQLQKCLLCANKMPQMEYFNKLKSYGAGEVCDSTNISKKSVSCVLNKLLNLKSLMLQSYPETKKLQNETSASKIYEKDEEISSESESNASELDDNEYEPPVKKSYTLENYEKILQTSHDLYKPYRNNVIQNWNEKTRVAVAKSNINVNSVINQIEFVLKDVDKCVKRTQLKRSNYDIMGQNLNASSADPVDHEKANIEYYKEIFDDDDFYHQLLRELIEFKSTDIMDPVQLSRQWIELQNMRSKMKRKIDTKATKGRKIRYAVHPKLVNFMAPIPDNYWSDEAKVELFNSLFGVKSSILSK